MHMHQHMSSLQYSQRRRVEGLCDLGFEGDEADASPLYDTMLESLSSQRHISHSTMGGESKSHRLIIPMA